jgi:hypothetical protein
MNLFKSFTLKWWQGSLFKLSMIAFGLAVGATWPELFVRWITVLWLFFIASGLYITWLWWKQ